MSKNNDSSSVINSKDGTNEKTSQNQKFITVAIVGKPNAGKSTLLNRLIGSKISIVTPKVQTTRTIITGIVTHENTQLVLLDTPGIFEPKRKLEMAMVRCAWSSLNNVDKVALIIDSTKPIDEFTNKIISRLVEAGCDIILLMNKVDEKKKFVASNITHLLKICPQAKLMNISAKTGYGVADLEDHLIECAGNAAWHYDSDDMTNLPLRFLTSEITREQLFLNLQQELPYNLTVECETWEENKKDGSITIRQVIIVSRESYKTIILGKKGEMIKKIGTQARINIEKMVSQKVHLFLFVKVRKNWDSNIVG